jgi:hypothetical protein
MASSVILSKTTARVLIAMAIFLAILIVALYLFDAARTLQWRMTEASTFAALPSLRSIAASDGTAHPAHAAIAQAKLRATAAHDSTIRPASILDTADGGVPKTDVRLQVSHTAPTPPLLPSMVQACSYGH